MFFFVCKCISDSGAMARAADRLVLEGNEPNERGQRRPVIIGYGNGRGNGGGHKGEQGVPVKAMYRALMPDKCSSRTQSKKCEPKKKTKKTKKTTKAE